MNWQQLYESEKKKREAAEAKVNELEGVVRASREDEHLVDALREAGVPPSAWKAAAHAMRSSATIEFDGGRFDSAELDGRLYLNPVDFARAFLRAHPNFTAEHIDAVKRAQGESETARGGDEGEPQFAGADAWKNGTPEEIAQLAWSKPPAVTPSADPFADFIKES